MTIDVAPTDPHRGRARRRGCDRGRLRGLAGDEQCTQAVREGRAGGILAAGAVLDFARRLRAQNEVTGAGVHFLQEDSLDEIGRAIAAWMLKL